LTLPRVALLGSRGRDSPRAIKAEKRKSKEKCCSTSELLQHISRRRSRSPLARQHPASEAVIGVPSQSMRRLKDESHRASIAPCPCRNPHAPFCPLMRPFFTRSAYSRVSTVESSRTPDPPTRSHQSLTPTWRGWCHRHGPGHAAPPRSPRRTFRSMRRARRYLG